MSRSREKRYSQEALESHTHTVALHAYMQHACMHARFSLLAKGSMRRLALYCEYDMSHEACGSVVNYTGLSAGLPFLLRISRRGLPC